MNIRRAHLLLPKTCRPIRQMRSHAHKCPTAPLRCLTLGIICIACAQAEHFTAIPCAAIATGTPTEPQPHRSRRRSAHHAKDQQTTQRSVHGNPPIAPSLFLKIVPRLAHIRGLTRGTIATTPPGATIRPVRRAASQGPEPVQRPRAPASGAAAAASRPPAAVAQTAAASPPA